MHSADAKSTLTSDITANRHEFESLHMTSKLESHVIRLYGAKLDSSPMRSEIVVHDGLKRPSQSKILGDIADDAMLMGNLKIRPNLRRHACRRLTSTFFGAFLGRCWALAAVSMGLPVRGRVCALCYMTVRVHCVYAVCVVCVCAMCALYMCDMLCCVSRCAVCFAVCMLCCVLTVLHT